MTYDLASPDAFAQRLQQACDKKGLESHGRGVAIARALSVTPRAVGKWLNAESVPRGAKMEQLAQFLDVPREWLQLGYVWDNNVQATSQPQGYNSYPLISWVSAGLWSEAFEPWPHTEVDRWPSTTRHVSENSFWLEVKGDSMTAQVGLSIPEGMMILVDPEVAATSGKLVIAKLTDANEATFKRYVEDGGHKYLKPLNPDYKMQEIHDDCRIIGVVVEAKWENLG
ncbi:LexA family protein [Duffyella gerundensis]|jgi:SOS-response transcriptional repressor LexA|uniref:LexA family protein n=1 Tax=Duffyella gerundensis TaxID=1619313 RepID=UPI001654500D|nr:XRE family transcriptional regulator [Duffyella gerundensis]